MKKLSFFIVVAMLAMMVSCNNKEAEQTEAQAQNPEEKEAIEQEQPAGLQALQLGQQLAVYGYENESPEALIEAANILAGVSTADLQAEIEKGQGETGEKEGEAKSFQPADLLEAARGLAGDNAELLAMIKRVEDKMAASTDGERGATCGATLHYDRVLAGCYDSYRVSFREGELAACAVVGDHTTDLDLYIYDENGNLIAKDDDYSDQCYCSWVPRWTGVFILKIVNRGNVYNDYSIAVN